MTVLKIGVGRERHAFPRRGISLHYAENTGRHQCSAACELLWLTRHTCEFPGAYTEAGRRSASNVPPVCNRTCAVAPVCNRWFFRHSHNPAPSHPHRSLTVAAL